jgi:hypothetical protein
MWVASGCCRMASARRLFPGSSSAAKLTQQLNVDASAARCKGWICGCAGCLLESQLVALRVRPRAKPYNRLRPRPASFAGGRSFSGEWRTFSAVARRPNGAPAALRSGRRDHVKRVGSRPNSCVGIVSTGRANRTAGGEASCDGGRPGSGGPIRPGAEVAATRLWAKWPTLGGETPLILTCYGLYVTPRRTVGCYIGRNTFLG